MTTWRNLGAVVGLWLAAGAGWAQTHALTEAARPGDCARYDIDLTLKGELRVTRDGKTAAIPLSATANHKFTERLLEVTDAGRPRKAARHYTLARSNVAVDGQPAVHDLRPDRRLVVAQRGPDAFLAYSPAGPLQSDEVELVSEHFDTLALTGLLPAKEVKPDDTWRLPNDVVLALGQFEALISHDLTAKLAAVADGVAQITVSGKAAGIELGAMATIEVTATARYELLARRLVSLEWTQKDERDQGPASPASTVTATTVVKRTPAETPAELADGALESVPKGLEAPPALTLVYHRDAKDRYDVAVTREWNLVAQTDTHLVLRLVDRGELVSQVALTPWAKAEPGKHASPAEFKKLVAEAPGWTLEEVLEEGEVPAENGRWIFRINTRGQMGESKVTQTFYLIAGPNGDQVVATFTGKPGQTAKLGSRDLTLVGAIGFPKK